MFALSIFQFNHIKPFAIHTYQSQLFSKDVIPTEYNAYKDLTTYQPSIHSNYLAVPWVYLINHNQLNKAPQIKLPNSFTICQHILFDRLLPILKKIGVNVLFSPHVIKDKKYEGIKILPFPHFPVNGIKPGKKEIYYSFVGWTSHPVREKIFAMHHPTNCTIIRRNRWFAGDPKEYKDILARSRFSLCPRGTGASTVRFWESIEAGAIPILISDEMTLPPCFDWNETIIQVEESDVENIPAILESISPEQEQTMRKNCLRIHEFFFNNQSDYIQWCFDNLGIN